MTEVVRTATTITPLSRQTGRFIVAPMRALTYSGSQEDEHAYFSSTLRREDDRSLVTC